MLADGSTSYALGQLSPDTVEYGCSRAAIIDFIMEQLPVWRDRADRQAVAAETKLTSQLCAHLNGAARKSQGWDCLQFRVEEADEVEASRKVDLVAAPAGDALIVEGRKYCDFEAIFPIECKRLPTPPGTERDEREYVATRSGVGGGIQRYKEGKHGAMHACAVLIAYVQDQSFDYWFGKISDWIQGLCHDGISGWSSDDALVALMEDKELGIAAHESMHSRQNRPQIYLRHLWIKMVV